MLQALDSDRSFSEVNIVTGTVVSSHRGLLALACASGSEGKRFCARGGSSTKALRSRCGSAIGSWR